MHGESRGGQEAGTSLGLLIGLQARSSVSIGQRGEGVFRERGVEKLGDVDASKKGFQAGEGTK